MTPHSSPSVSLPVNLVADIQDSLLMAMTDLKRLEGLLDHATGNLLERFSTANHALGNLAAQKDTDDLLNIRHSLHQAVTELQFHDMANSRVVWTRPPTGPARSPRTRWTPAPSTFSKASPLFADIGSNLGVPHAVHSCRR